MSLPVRCFTCNSLIGHHEKKVIEFKMEDTYEFINYDQVSEKSNDENSSKNQAFFKELGIKNECCKIIIMGYFNEFQN